MFPILSPASSLSNCTNVSTIVLRSCLNGKENLLTCRQSMNQPLFSVMEYCAVCPSEIEVRKAEGSLNNVNHFVVSAGDTRPLRENEGKRGDPERKDETF